MARKLISIDLDFLEKNVAPLFEVKQLDDITLSINMYMDGVEYDATGQTGLLSVKSTKGTYTQETDIVLDISKATIKVNNGMIQDQGVCYGELTLTDANGTMSSTDFVFLVSNRISEGGLDPGQIQSYYEQFKKLLADSTNKMDKALDDMATEKDAMFEEFSTGLTNLINNTQSQIDAQVLRVDTAIGAGTVDLETKDARTDMDGVAHANLRARLESDLKKGKEIYENVEGSYITVNDTVQGNIEDVEILGNTYQDPNNLANIVSAGIEQVDGKVKLSILSCGKNLFNQNNITTGQYYSASGGLTPDANSYAGNDYIKVQEGQKIVCNKLGTASSFQLCEYDATKTFKQRVNYSVVGSVYTVPDGVRYLRISSYQAGLGFKAQVELGTVVTSYEPYQESTAEIILPCQLEGLESGRDRLYYDKEEKAWCIDKFIDAIIINGTTINWTRSSSQSNGDTALFISAGIPGAMSLSSTVSNLFIDGGGSQYAGDVESIHFYANKNFNVRILKSKANSVADFNAWLNKNNLLVKFVREYPEKIILPLDIQIVLNSFANQTNIWIESGEVDGIIKGKVPKSLASSLQSAHTDIEKLDTRVKNIEGLQESQNFKYATSTGYQVCEQTKNGVIDKLKLSGRTLVNLGGETTPIKYGGEAGSLTINNDVYRVTNLDGASLTYLALPLTDDMKSKVIGKSIYLKLFKLAMSSSSVTFRIYNRTTAQSLVARDITFKDTIFKIDIPQSYKVSDVIEIIIYSKSIVNDWIECSNKILISYDDISTNSYFEGLASVGDGVDKLEVLSNSQPLILGKLRKQDDTLSITEELWRGNTVKGKIQIGQTAGVWMPIYLEKGISYVCKGLVENITNVRIYGSIEAMQKNCAPLAIFNNGDTGRNEFNTTFVSNFEGWVCFRLWVNTAANPFSIEGIEICKVTSTSKYKSHKKQILYYDPADQTWKKPILRGTDTIQDTIEQLDNGRSKYTRRVKTIQLLSTMNWGNGVSNSDSKLTQSFNVVVPGAKQNGEILGNRFNKNSVYSDDVGINCEATNDIYVRVLKSDLATVDIDGWKVKLKAWEDEGTPLEIVYEVAEEIYECTPLNLNSYADETMIQFCGGPIAPHMEFEVTSFISNLILNNRDRLSNLEKFIYEQNLAMFTIGLNVLNNNLQGGN